MNLLSVPRMKNWCANEVRTRGRTLAENPEETNEIGRNSYNSLPKTKRVLSRKSFVYVEVN